MKRNREKRPVILQKHNFHTWEDLFFMLAVLASRLQHIVNVSGESLCKEENGWQRGVGAGLVGTEGVLFGVSLSPSFFVSSFEMWGGERRVTGLCSYLSKEVHLHSRYQSHTDTLADWSLLLWTVAFLQAKGQYTPVLENTGVLEMIVNDLPLGIRKHCCCAKLGAASPIRYQTLDHT